MVDEITMIFVVINTSLQLTWFFWTLEKHKDEKHED